MPPGAHASATTGHSIAGISYFDGGFSRDYRVAFIAECREAARAFLYDAGHTSLSIAPLFLKGSVKIGLLLRRLAEAGARPRHGCAVEKAARTRARSDLASATSKSRRLASTPCTGRPLLSTPPPSISPCRHDTCYLHAQSQNMRCRLPDARYLMLIRLN